MGQGENDTFVFADQQAWHGLIGRFGVPDLYSASLDHGLEVTAPTTTGQIQGRTSRWDRNLMNSLWKDMRLFPVVFDPLSQRSAVHQPISPFSDVDCSASSSCCSIPYHLDRTKGWFRDSPSKETSFAAHFRRALRSISAMTRGEKVMPCKANHWLRSYPGLRYNVVGVVRIAVVKSLASSGFNSPAWEEVRLVTVRRAGERGISGTRICFSGVLYSIFEGV